MNELESRLFNSLLEYWQLVINELVKSLTDAYPGSSGNTRQEITVANVNPIGKTNTGYKVSLFMPDYYEYMDKGVSGAEFNTSRSEFKYRNFKPPTSAIRKFMKNRGITEPRPSARKPPKKRPKLFKRKTTATNTRAGQKKGIESILQGIAFAIAHKIWSEGLEASNFYSDVINDKKLQAFEQKLLDDYGDYILGVIKI